MTNRKAPYSHADGSNCWTHDCSRRGGAEVIAHSKNKYVSSFEEEERAEEERAERVRFQNSFDLMKERIDAEEKATAERIEKMRLERKAKMEDMLPLLKQVPEWQAELANEDDEDDHDLNDWEYDYDDEEDYDGLHKLHKLDKWDYQDNTYIKKSKELEEYLLLPKQEASEYGIKSFPIRQSGAVELSDGLARAAHLAFNNIPSESSFGRKYSHLAVGSLKKIGSAEYADWVEARSAVLNEKVYECIRILNDVREYSSNRRSRFEEYRLGRRITKLNEEVSEVFQRPLSSKERNDAFNRKWDGARAKPMVVNMDIAHPDLRPAFGLGETQRQAIPASAQNPGVWLRSAFPEVSREYNKTEELLETANTMKQGIEDEYFVEQVSASYYPAIHQSLKAVSGKDVSPSHREAVIGETKAQLALIQDGLQRIIDSNVSRSVQETKAQTEFLRAKMGQNRPELELPVQLPNRPARPSITYPKGYSA